jgi:tetratricopeptide (TPR) repeat protein
MEWVDRGTTASRGAVFVRIGVLALFAVLPVVLAGSASAAQAPAGCEHPVARFESVTNTVRLVRASTQAGAAARQALVCAGDVVRVGDNSRAVILILASNTPIAIDSNSEFIVADPPAPDRTLITLLRGALLYISRVRRSLAIQTPFVNASTEGTEFLVRVGEDSAIVTVLEGSVRASNEFGSLLVAAGQQAVARRDRAPELEVIVRPRDAVRWALYYEPVLPLDTSAELEKVPEDKRDSQFHVRRAALALSAGQLQEARSDIELALKLDPSNADAYALQAVVAVALNDKEGALKAGAAAVERSPRSAAALVAHSYALQANFQLDAARDVAVRAVQAQPDDATAWTRVAELRLMLDDVDGARAAAQRANTLAPRLPRTQVVHGFTSLAELKPSEAETAFNEAIDLQPDNPLARLGLGLVKIRRGRLSEGRQDLETAVALNPDDALIRSYLGKAYFDEKREDLAGQQLDAAKTLDPLDPTPWFYDAIRKQTLNRPVDALFDIERAIALNDNRAVYRSRLLLDQDLAARSASLGRVYRDLGFEQPALVEAWKSVEADPSDYAGHRFLADSYSTLPRHEVARVSELLQAQLLQPISLTPVSPRLAETDLFILEIAGPAEPAFNEFSPLFSRDRVAAQLHGAFGNEDILGDELTVSGVWNRLSFSLGQLHYSTDGLRANNGQDRDIFNALIQARLSPATSVQAEIRSEDHDLGDLFINFDPTDFAPQQRTRIDGVTTRLGMLHRFAPNSELIASFYARSQDTHFTEHLAEHDITLNQDTMLRSDGLTAEVRHLLRLNRWNLTTGVGWFRSSRDRDHVTEAEIPPFVFRSESHFSDDPEQTNAYAYSNIDLAKHVTLTAGASADFYRRTFFQRSQFNPKLGLSWRASPSTTVRVAAFRTLHRSSVSNQTIEPTQVAGFNQLFAEVEGTEARRYGIAVDQKLGSRVFAGAEYARRDLRVPVEFAEGETRIVTREKSTERFARSYVNWAPARQLSVSLGYTFEDFDGAAAASGFEDALSVHTHRLPMSFRYFGARGLMAQLGTEYLNQKGTFFIHGIATDGADQFWVADAAIGYRLPRRFGRLVLKVQNLFDSDFNFQDTDPGNPIIRRGRLAVLRFTVGI